MRAFFLKGFIENIVQKFTCLFAGTPLRRAENTPRVFISNRPAGIASMRSCWSVFCLTVPSVQKRFWLPYIAGYP